MNTTVNSSKYKYDERTGFLFNRKLYFAVESSEWRKTSKAKPVPRLNMNNNNNFNVELIYVIFFLCHSASGSFSCRISIIRLSLLILFPKRIIEFSALFTTVDEITPIAEAEEPPAAR